MKVIGHTNDNRNLDLNKVVLVATSDELRRVAEFFHATAKRMDEMGPDDDHEHLADHTAGIESAPHLVVVRGA